MEARGFSRRIFLRHGIRTAGAVALGRLWLPDVFQSVAYAQAAGTVHLTAREALLEMVDLTRVYHWAWEAQGQGPKIPGPVLFATEGQRVTVTVSNALDEDHAFAVHGVAGTETGPIAAGQTREVSFDAPPPGTYIYLDPLNAPVNRVLGLHGMMIVLPREGTNPYGERATPNVAKFFNDLGRSPFLPGEAWTPDKTNIWIFSSIDPRFNEMALRGQRIDPAQFVAEFDARYFSIDGQQGYFAAHNEAVEIRGLAGQPKLIRNINVGQTVHSPHIHANHGMNMWENGAVRDNLGRIDTWTMKPLDAKDVLYPMTAPPDIPADTWERLISGRSEETFLDNPMLPRRGGFPMFYPMHCHLELSQTANGGSYPQGLVTHIVFEGALPGVKPFHEDESIPGR